jgi:hypothetical protein
MPYHKIGTKKRTTNINVGLTLYYSLGESYSLIGSKLMTKETFVFLLKQVFKWQSHEERVVTVYWTQQTIW